jgi:hypothetical protein
MPDNLRKRLFQLTAFANFIMVFIYQYLTPNMSDDIIYSDKVSEAGSFFGLFVQEYEHYMTHIGRSIAHIILRIFLYIGNKVIFDIVAAAVFVMVSILIYLNVDHRKKYDIRVYAAIAVLMWLFDPTIANSVFWETGACNYMFTGCIMLSFITVFRKYLAEDRKSVGAMIGMFFLGLLAGWCNENTSGAVILFIMIMIFAKWRENRNFSQVRPWMVTGLVGSIIGFMIMILSPGNFNRAASAEEAHTGLLALAARFLKITLNIKEGYLVLILTFIVFAIAMVYRTLGKSFMEKASGMMLFGLLFLVTCYALIAVPQSQLRTYYGAGLFLMIAVASGFAWFVNEGFKDDLVQVIGTGIVTIFGVILIFTYVEEGANLARIKREFEERDAYLIEMKKGDEMQIEAPMLRPQWKTKYSVAYESDLTEDKDNWLNLSYAEHYGYWFVVGVDRETWTAY